MKIASVLLAVACLASAGAAHADNLMAVWRAAQVRDPAFLAARQTMQLAQQRATLFASNSEQAQAHLQVARERFRLAEQELTLRVARSYFDTLSAREGADLALAQLNAMAQQLRTVQRGTEMGVGSEAEVREARVRFDAARAQRVAAMRELELRSAELEKIAGRMPEQLDGLRMDAALWSPEPADPVFWTSLASESNPRVRLHKASLEAAVQEVEHQRDNGSPSVDITANRSRIFSDGSLSTPAEMAVRARSAQLGFVLTVPLEDNAPESRLREAQALQERSEAELAVVRGQAAAQAEQAFSGVVQGLARSQALSDAARAGRRTLEGLQAGLRAGARLRTDVLAAVQQFYSAERDWFKARIEAVVQGLQLKAAAGRLDEAEMARLNAMLGGLPAAPAAAPVVSNATAH
ncbi:TolC family protein [uncultured Ramlibacter sp.]|uniref:TolC family protein n=1 Tax=uncultured Ramlibacter sp. TaxID=260755 RepID=UPI0026399DB5|nr:TolC family protein [uncultured Ramlibacter sp.]